MDLIEDIRELAHVQEIAYKQKMAWRFDAKVRTRNFQEGDTVLRRIMNLKKRGKLSPN